MCMCVFIYVVFLFQKNLENASWLSQKLVPAAVVYFAWSDRKEKDEYLKPEAKANATLLAKVFFFIYFYIFLFNVSVFFFFFFLFRRPHICPRFPIKHLLISQF